MHMPSDPAIPLLEMHTRRVLVGVLQEMGARMLMANCVQERANRQTRGGSDQLGGAWWCLVAGVGEGPLEESSQKVPTSGYK